jgi:hypothetical protein
MNLTRSHAGTYFSTSLEEGTEGLAYILEREEKLFVSRHILKQICIESHQHDVSHQHPNTPCPRTMHGPTLLVLTEETDDDSEAHTPVVACACSFFTVVRGEKTSLGESVRKVDVCGVHI